MINKFFLNSPTVASIVGGLNLYTWGNLSAALGQNITVGSRTSPTRVGTDTVWADISAGTEHTLALKSDGTLWGWGENSCGQLAYDDKISWSVVASGVIHSSAIKTDGTLWGWGTNNVGQLGDNTTTIRTLVQIGTDTDWQDVQAQNNTSIAIKTNGTLWGWGSNYTGQLGQSDVINRSSPVQIGVGNSWTQISCNAVHTVAIRTDGTLWGWGDASSGQFGPTFNDTTSWSQIGLASLTAYAIKPDGTLWGWGYNASGQLGQSNTIMRSSPVQIGVGFSWTQICSSNGAAVLAIRTDGTLWGWGTNGVGVLGDGTTVAKSSPVQIGIGFSWTKVATSGSHTVAIRADGSLWGWGTNTSGQLGQSDVINRSSPVQIGTANSWTSVAASSQSTAAIYTTMDLTNPLLPVPITSLWMWGANSLGQLGQANTISRSSPVQVGSIANSWTKIGLGDGHIIATRADGSLWSWGANSLGQLGSTATTTRSSPVQVGSNTWTELNCGATSSIAIRTDGTLWSWGNNAAAQLGDGTSMNKSSPVQIGNGNSWDKVAVNGSNLIALSSTNEVYMCGSNSQRQLFQPGYSTNLNPVGKLLKLNTINHSAFSSPVQIGTDSNWTSVDSSYGKHTLAIKSDGSLWAWGQGSPGNLGENTNTAIFSPMKIGSSSWIKIVATASSGSPNGDDGHSMAIRSDGLLFSWGNGTEGNIGDGSTSPFTKKSSPVQIGTSTWGSIFGTMGHCYAIRTDGMLYAWGGQGGAASYLGVGYPIGAKDVPTASGVLPGNVASSWAKISVGRQSGNSPYTQGITATGELYWWGISINNGNASGGAYLAIFHYPQKGFAYKTVASPVQIGTSSWTKITATGGNSYAIKADGTLWGWGANTNGQLGNGNTFTYTSPIQIGISSWSKIGIGGLGSTTSPVNSNIHVLAITSDGTLWGWGVNTAGQLGQSDVINRSSPVQIGVGNTWAEAARGTSHSMAIRSDGTLWGWGGNTSGQLGQSDLIARSSPIQIGVGNSWTMCSTVSSTSFAIRTDGTLWGWGSATIGQLGDATTVAKSSPVQIGVGFSWASISTGVSVSMAIRSDNTLWGWGDNRNYQLGLGNTLTYSSPVKIGSLSWTKVSSGTSHSAGLTSQ